MLKLKFAGALFAALTALSPASANAQNYPEMNIRVAHFFSSAAVQSQIDAWWASEIEKRSGGKIKVKIFWAESMGKASEVLDLVGSGAVEMGATAPGYFPSRLPLSGITNSLPLVFKSNRQAQLITTALAEMPDIQEEHKRNKVWPVFYHSINNFKLLCTKPVAKLADIKGLKIRSYGEYVPKMWEALGAVGINTMTPELYEGLERGKLDCSYFPDELSGGLKLYEVAKYESTADFGAIPTWPIYVNYDLWHNKWPAEVKALIAQVSKEAAARDIEMVAAAGRSALEKATKDNGVKVVTFQDQPQLVETAPDFMAMWVANMKKKGLGDAAQRIADKWKKLLAEIH